MHGEERWAGMLLVDESSNANDPETTKGPCDEAACS